MSADMRRLNYKISDQIQILEQLIDGSIELVFEPTGNYPGREDIDNLISILDKSISDSENNRLIVELQLIVFLTIIQGVGLYQALTLTARQWNKLDRLTFQGKNSMILSKNRYCNELVERVGESKETEKGIFQVLTRNNALQCLNLFMVINGYECTLTEEKLRLTFGRFLYLRHGRFKCILEFLKKYFECETHIDLLVTLKLVYSVHYNTMMRN